MITPWSRPHRYVDPALLRAALADVDTLRQAALALALDRARARDRDLALALVRARDRARELLGCADRIQLRLVELAGRSSPGVPGGQPHGVRPSGMAVRMHGWTAKLLLPAARTRHADELLDELYDLAEQGGTMRAQVACALRQLATVRRLRATARAAKTSSSVAGGE
jgi:hypothetical protein